MTTTLPVAAPARACGTGIVTISAPMVPRAKGRPRFGRGRTYTDEKTAGYEADLRALAAIEMGARPPIGGPVRLYAEIRVPVPKSWSKLSREKAFAGRLAPTARPDLDNYLKALADGINRIVIGDDAQIVAISACKIYSAEPGITLQIVPEELP